MPQRFIGIDIGAETLKLVELVSDLAGVRRVRSRLVAHGKAPGQVLPELLAAWDWPSVDGAAVCGRLGQTVALPHIPTHRAQTAACAFLRPGLPTTVMSLGSRSFTVLEIPESGLPRVHESSRCAQGTGNFLCQLVARFGLSVAEAAAACAEVTDPVPLSSRCPVVMKTDMTHLANKGENRAGILAGLFDAVCDNARTLVRPRCAPPSVLLVGGLAQAARVQNGLGRALALCDMRLEPLHIEDALTFDALGAALLAVEFHRSGRGFAVPPLEGILAPPRSPTVRHGPALAQASGRVHRLAAEPTPPDSDTTIPLMLGLDVGSTGCKLVALAAGHRQPHHQNYAATRGDPVAATQGLLRDFQARPAGAHAIAGFGVTGSGREIVGTLLGLCFGTHRVHIAHEIAAHAEGALHFDPRVDTIVEIGGQDAKYIRLENGQVVEMAMNDVCSAGTGSFIEEQGRRLAGVADLAQLGREALAAESTVDLGQHCAVFMAEVIDEAVAAGASRPAILAGLHEAVARNYLHRVKGQRPLGQVVFCQGMPFSSDALAAALARQSDSDVIVPPDPGTVGALGIARLAHRELRAPLVPACDLDLFLAARVDERRAFACGGESGCKETGHRCRVDRLRATAAGTQRSFSWGGACAERSRGPAQVHVPADALDPFAQRAQRLRALLAELRPRAGRPRVALTDELALKGLLPFFATFVHELGLNLDVAPDADESTLRRGIEGARIPFCAPMQMFHGAVAQLAERAAFDHLLLPLLHDLPPVGDEPYARTCPITQASTEILRLDLGQDRRLRTPVINMGREGLDSKELRMSCRRMAIELGARRHWQRALVAARAAQRRFDEDCAELGRAALRNARDAGLLPVVVLGRPYTIHSRILSANVPAILRAQGALAIPVDCYPIDDDVPVWHDLYWGQAQRNLRAAHQVRRRQGVYALYCSNYGCGPDSFALTLFAHAMQGKPYAVIESDGHRGDGGTRTRIEAFLQCARTHRAATTESTSPSDLSKLAHLDQSLRAAHGGPARLLVPRMGPGAEALAACLRGAGFLAECLPPPDASALRMGQRHTSGKECLPACLTLGSLLDWARRTPGQPFAFFMPKATGPCRFGMYHWLHKLTLDRLGLGERGRVWSTVDSGHFEGMPPGFSALSFTGFMAADLLLEGLHDVRPVEKEPGSALPVYQRFHAELLALLEQAGAGDLRSGPLLREVRRRRLWGVVDLLRRAGAAYAAVRSGRQVPTVLLVGEIYVRCEPFANGFVVDELERRGLRTLLAPFNEWLEYADWLGHARGQRKGLSAAISTLVQNRMQTLTYRTMARALDWPARASVDDILSAAHDYLGPELHGEAILTLGAAVHAWRSRRIAGAVSVGPLECMASKIAETQLSHAAEREGLPILTMPCTGDGPRAETLDAFAFDVHARHARHGPIG